MTALVPAREQLQQAGSGKLHNATTELKATGQIRTEREYSNWMQMAGNGGELEWLGSRGSAGKLKAKRERMETGELEAGRHSTHTLQELNSTEESDHSARLYSGRKPASVQRKLAEKN